MSNLLLRSNTLTTKVETCKIQTSPTDLWFTQRVEQVAVAGINEAPHSVLAALTVKVRLLCYGSVCGIGEKNGYIIRGFTLASCVVI